MLEILGRRKKNVSFWIAHGFVLAIEEVESVPRNLT
jgi:hypothetical protein